MNVKKIASSALVLFLGLCGNTFAVGFNADYYPPERITCEVSQTQQISCSGFDRRFLKEDTHTADPAGKRYLTFYFQSGAAYHTPDRRAFSIFFTYTNTDGKVVKLKTVSEAIQPDLLSGHWEQYKDEFYVCDTGYMSCPLTHLPRSAAARTNAS